MLVGLTLLSVTLLLGVAAWLSWLNRSSEAVRSGWVTAIGVGIAALLVTLWFGLKAPEERHHRFPVVFVIDRTTRLPLSFWNNPAIARYADPGSQMPIQSVAVNRQPTDEKLAPLEPEDINGFREVYPDVLAGYVTDTLVSLFHKSWDADVFVSETAHVRSFSSGARLPVKPGSQLTLEDLVKWLPHREVVVSVPRLADSLIAPPKTHSLGWQAKDGFVRELRLANPFVTVAISITFQGYGRTVGGLALFSPPLSDNENVGTFSYVLTLDASFERLLSGHPRMPDYARWVDTMFDQLRGFDAERRWEGLKRDYVILREQGVAH